MSGQFILFLVVLRASPGVTTVKSRLHFCLGRGIRLMLANLKVANKRHVEKGVRLSERVRERSTV